MYRILIASSLCILAASCSNVRTPDATVNVPDKLKPQGDEALVQIVPAKGVQLYECRAKSGEVGGYGWTFVAPVADLFDSSGNKIGRHYAGPHWESVDGSKISGVVKASAAAPRPDAIPWLLLATTPVGAQGAFSNISSVQRVNTVGGVAPKSGCSQHTVGTTARVPYMADYYLLAKR